MSRYFRLYLCFLRFSFSKALAFRMDFYFRVAMDAAFYAVNLAFFGVLYRHTTELGGWTLDQTWIFVCGFLWVDAVQMTVSSNNFWWLPTLINRGDLDYYLVRPVSSLFFLTLREFAANSFLNLVIACALVVWSLARYPEPLGAPAIAVFILFLTLGALILMLLRLLFLIPVFWLHSSRGLDEVFWSLSKLAQRPHQIYRGWLRVVLVTVLPLAFMFSVPAHVLFDGLDARGALHALAITGGLFALVVWLWHRGLRAYVSASS